MKAFPLEVIEATMYKKPYVYTYASPLKYIILVENTLLCVCTCIL